MKKSLLDQPAVDELLSRTDQLMADSPNRWGTMTVAEMLLHCTLANKFILEDKSPYINPTLKERLFKFAGLYIISKFPKHRKGPLRINAKNKISPECFNEQKQIYRATLLRFPTHGQPFTSIHSGMGYLTTAQWGKIAWMHMDHHLRQFGV